MNERPQMPEDKIARLLRLTGPRPAVPADRAARVREAARAQWRASVRGRTRGWTARRLLAVAAAASVAATAGIVAWRGLRAPAAPEIVGRVEVGTAAMPRFETVRAGATLTTDHQSRLAIRLTTGHSIRLDRDSRLSLVADRTLALERGAVYVDSTDPRAARAAPPGSIAVRTSSGVVRDLGTQFEIRLDDDGMQLRVREGSASIERATGSLEVTAGRELSIDAAGQTRERATPGDAGHWDWIGEVTPMMAIEGRTLGEFLDWLARERGLTVRYAGDDLAASSTTIRLNGSIDGMTLDQALDSVLLTCNLARRIEAGVLIVEPRL